MVDVTIVNGDYFMVYKPPNITGGPHPVCTQPFVPIDPPGNALGLQ